MEQIFFTRDVGKDLGRYISGIGYSKLGVITDSNTAVFCYPLVREFLPEQHLQVSFEAGESHKNLNTCINLWDWMTSSGLDRKALIINLGGGVTGDMGGFCAATYKRGIRFINVPTTLLSQVDASVGGKLGIDFQGYKNHLGVFTDPQAVFISTAFLTTLPKEELRSGFAEVIKHGLIMDAGYFNSLEFENWTEQDWEKLIQKSIWIKKEVVEKDPHEEGLRKILNFGHTIGHAVESKYLGSEKHLLHGEAIAIGMICEAWLSTQKSGLPTKDLERICEGVLSVFGKKTIPKEDLDEILNLCSQDKKNIGNTMNFSLLREIGTCDFNIPVNREEILFALQYYQSL